VRGLDYYTRTISEYKDTSGALGAQDTLGAGGRYDNLIAELGGKATPAVGWALGVERLLLSAPDLARKAPPSVIVVALAKPDDASVCGPALAIANELRSAGIVVHIDTRFGKADRQFRLADKTGARAAVVLGAQEIASGTVGLKDLTARTQSTVARAELAATLHALLSRTPEEQATATSG